MIVELGANGGRVDCQKPDKSHSEAPYITIGEFEADVSHF